MTSPNFPGRGGGVVHVVIVQKILLAGDILNSSSSSSGVRKLRNYTNLLASTNDAVALAILDLQSTIDLLLTFPDLHLHTSTYDTHTQGGEDVCGSVGVTVDSAVEHGSSILANTSVDHGTTTRVLGHELGDIVDNTGNTDERTTVLALVDVVIPFHDGEVVERNTPVKCGALLVELLLELLNTALFDLVGTELLEIVGETELLPCPDVPLGRVVLVPFDGVAVVGRKLVVEVVVALAESDKSSDDVVARRVAVVEWLVTEPVSKGVDTEGGLLHEEDAEDTSVDESTLPVTPAETSYDTREEETHDGDDKEVVLVLPSNNGVLVEIRDVGAANTLGVLLHDHPAEVRVEETLANRVRILVSVGVSVVSAVITRPPSDGTLDSTSTNCGKVDS